MFGSILVLASSVARAASKYHLLLRDPHFSVIAVLVSSTANQGGTLKGCFVAKNAHVFSGRRCITCKNQLWRIAENIYSAANFFAFTNVLDSIEVKVLSRTPEALCLRYCYILTTVQQAVRLRLGPFMLSFKNTSIRGKDSRLNFMRWSRRYTPRFVHSEKHRSENSQRDAAWPSCSQHVPPEKVPFMCCAPRSARLYTSRYFVPSVYVPPLIGRL